MPYKFEKLFAADPERPELVAANGLITIYQPGDPTKAPVPIKDALSGVTLPNPLPVNAAGWGPAVEHESLDRLAWEGGGFSNIMTSYEGIKEEAVAARHAADEARAAAQEAARGAEAPTVEAVASAITSPGPAREAIGAVVTAGIDGLRPDNGGKPVGKGELAVNVRDYGATGNGVAVETALIQAAIDATPTGGTLIFPGNFTYNLGAGVLEVTRAIRVEGGSFRSATGRAIRVTGSGAEIRGANITGPGTTVPYVKGNPGIEVRGTNTGYITAKIIGCTIRGMRDTGIAAEYVRDIEVSGNTVENFRYAGIMLNSVKRGTVSYNTVREAVQDTVGLSYGIAISDLENTVAARSEDVSVSFNHVEGVRDGEGIDTHGGKNITFASNTVKECRNGIVLTVGSNNRTTAPQGCRVIGNYITAPILTGQRITAGVAVGGSASGNPLHPLMADAVVVGNNLAGTTVPLSLAASTGATVDRVKSIFANNAGDTPPVTDETDTGWVPITDYGTLRSGYASNSAYPARIRVVRNRQSTRVMFEGVISVSASPAPSDNVFFVLGEATGLRPSFDRMVGTAQTVAGAIQRYQLSVNTAGAYRTIFPSTTPDANFTIAGEYVL